VTAKHLEAMSPMHTASLMYLTTIMPTPVPLVAVPAISQEHGV